jgi:hypothetical protein
MGDCLAFEAAAAAIAAINGLGSPQLDKELKLGLSEDRCGFPVLQNLRFWRMTAVRRSAHSHRRATNLLSLRSLPACWFDRDSSLQRVLCYDVGLTVIATHSIQLPRSMTSVNEISVPFSVWPQKFANTSGTICLAMAGSLRVQGRSTCFGLFCS